ncbi:MAG: ABC transporter permease [Sarcina sp.]
MGAKYSFRNFKKNKIFIILIIIQIIVGLYAIYTSIDNLSKANYEKMKIETYFESDKIFTLNFTDILTPTETETITDLGDLLNETFLKVENIDGINMFNNIFLYNTVSSEKYDYHNDNAEIMYLNTNIIEKYNLTLETGELLSRENFTDNNIFLGQDFKGLFKVDDKLKIDESEFTVFGFLDTDLSIPSMLDAYEVDFRNLNTVFLTSSNNLNNADLGINKHTLNYFWFDENLDNNIIEEHLSLIKKEFVDVGFNPNIFSVNSTVNKLLEQHSNKFTLNLFIGVLVSIAVFITLVISILDSIEKRLQEFGIYIFSGATINNIVKIIFIEVTSIVFISFNLFIILIFLIFKTVNIKYLLILTIGLTIFIAFTMIIPTLKIKSITIKDMINEVY